MFVFGINVPLVEILLLLTIVLTIFLIIIIVGFRNLKEMMLIQQSDVAHLEQGISQLGIQKTQDTSKIEGFVRSAISKGYSPTHVRHALLKQNWPIETVDKIFNKVFGKG